MPSVVLIVVYCVLIVVSSLGGGWLPSAVRLTHERMQLMMSGVAGLMLGVGLFHLVPHSLMQTREPGRTMLWVMIGLLTMFFLIRAFHFHQHDAHIPAEGAAGHDHHHHGSAGHFRWIGVGLGLSLHTLIDGMALAASVQADEALGDRWPLYGLGVFLAILLHKPLDAMSITSLMAAKRVPAVWRQAVNVGFALMCPLGALLFWLGSGRFGNQQQNVVVGCALGFSAGVFLCIAGDLLPEVQFHEHDRVKLSLALLLGVGIAYALCFLEPHSHVKHPTAADSEVIDDRTRS